jgi:siroheme synthase-like protein
MNELYPIFIKADQVNILLVGGGNVALEKLHFLLKSSPDAKVHLVSKIVSEAIIDLVKEKRNINISIRAFKPDDLINKHLVIAATNDPILNAEIKSLSNEQGTLLNVADKADLCDFFLGGVVTKGDLKLAISTNGKSPIMARRLREFFEAELPENLDEVIKELKILRGKLIGSFERKLHTLNELTKQLITDGNY